MFYYYPDLYYKKWFLILGNLFLPLIMSGMMAFFTFLYPYELNNWLFIFSMNLILGVLTFCSMIILRSARIYKIVFSIAIIGMLISTIYAIKIIIETDFDNSVFIKSIIALFIIIEWLFSYFYGKLRIRRVSTLKIPNNALDVDEGFLDLQRKLVTSRNTHKESLNIETQMDLQNIELEFPKDEKEPFLEMFVMVICLIIIFTPFVLAFAYDNQNSGYRSSFIFFCMIFFAMLFSFGSGFQAGFSRVINEMEKENGKKIVIKKLE